MTTPKKPFVSKFSQEEIEKNLAVLKETISYNPRFKEFADCPKFNEYQETILRRVASGETSMEHESELLKNENELLEEELQSLKENLERLTTENNRLTEEHGIFMDETENNFTQIVTD